MFEIIDKNVFFNTDGPNIWVIYNFSGVDKIHIFFNGEHNRILSIKENKQVISLKNIYPICKREHTLIR